jgi:hypothetical protein
MTETLKVLGQSAPAAATLTPLYTVPGGVTAAGSSLVICNQNAAQIKYRVSVAVAGAADTSKQYLFFDTILNGNTTTAVVIGISLAATDVVRVESDTTATSFTLFGIEVT